MRTSHSAGILSLLFSLVLAGSAAAQVPERLLLQGSVYLNGQPYQGTGRMKVALVSPDGARSHWSNDGTSTVGDEPADAVAVEVARGAYSLMLGDASLANMLPVPSGVFTNAAVHVRIWFSDGTRPFAHLAPDEPLVPVGYAMMAARVVPGAVGAEQLADGAVTAAKLAPRSVTADALAEGAVAANLKATGGVTLSTRSEDPVLTAAGLAQVGTLEVAGEQWRRLDFTVPPPRQGHVALWTGTEMVVLGARNVSDSYSSTLPGFRYEPGTGTWRSLPITNAPTAAMLGQTSGDYSRSFSAGWTGSEVLFWSARQRTGLRCEPSGTTWRTLGRAGALSARYGQASVWTGTEWILWGGTALSGDRSLADGARYRPDTDTWIPMSSEGAPTGRESAVALWNGKEVILAGGVNLAGDVSTAVWSYDPATDKWTRLSTGTPPVFGTWTRGCLSGSELLLFSSGLGSGLATYDAGIRFDLVTRKWKAISHAGAPFQLQSFSLTWTGTEVILWGGATSKRLPAEGSALEGRGYSYNPVTDTWRETGQTDAPAGRVGHSAVWTGQEMLVWGGGFGSPGSQLDAGRADGGRYRPGEDRWLPIVEPALTRFGAAVAWTGTDLLVWGGTNQIRGLGVRSGARFRPATGGWQPISARNSPTPRVQWASVWTGRELVVHGGFDADPSSISSSFAGLATGARYDPTTDRWASLPVDETVPAARGAHSAVWTGTELIVWGGLERRNGLALNTGARLDLASGTWRSLSTRLGAGALPARSGHRAVWTGREMIVWGGNANPVRGLRYDPERDRWSELSTTGAPTQSLVDPPLIWTGEEVLTFGGRWYFYNPVRDAWRLASTRLAPGWNGASAGLWTGREVIVWGGAGNLAHRYDPAGDLWTRMSSVNAPAAARTGFAAVLADDRLYVIGGANLSQARTESLTQSLWVYARTRPLYLYGSP